MTNEREKRLSPLRVDDTVMRQAYVLVPRDTKCHKCGASQVWKDPTHEEIEQTLKRLTELEKVGRVGAELRRDHTMNYRDALETLRNFICLTEQSPETTVADIREFAAEALKRFGFDLHTPILKDGR